MGAKLRTFLFQNKYNRLINSVKSKNTAIFVGYI